MRLSAPRAFDTGAIVACAGVDVYRHIGELCSREHHALNCRRRLGCRHELGFHALDDLGFVRRALHCCEALGGHGCGHRGPIDHRGQPLICRVSPWGNARGTKLRRRRCAASKACEA